MQSDQNILFVDPGLLMVHLMVATLLGPLVGYVIHSSDFLKSPSRVSRERAISGLPSMPIRKWEGFLDTGFFLTLQSYDTNMLSGFDKFSQSLCRLGKIFFIFNFINSYSAKYEIISA